MERIAPGLPTTRRGSYSLAELRVQRDAVLAVAAKFGAFNVRVFGSIARGTQASGSDVDLLVDMAPDHSLLDRAALTVALQELLGGAVDVATPGSLRDRIRPVVLAEAQPL